MDNLYRNACAPSDLISSPFLGGGGGGGEGGRWFVILFSDRNILAIRLSSNNIQNLGNGHSRLHLC